MSINRYRQNAQFKPSRQGGQKQILLVCSNLSYVLSVLQIPFKLEPICSAVEKIEWPIYNRYATLPPLAV